MIHWIEEGRLEGETLVVRDGDTEWAAASVCLATLKAVAAGESSSAGVCEAGRTKAGQQPTSNVEMPQEIEVNPRGLSKRHDSVDV